VWEKLLLVVLLGAENMMSAPVILTDVEGLYPGRLDQELGNRKKTFWKYALFLVAV
jgi:hypothetical protein